MLYFVVYCMSPLRGESRVVFLCCMMCSTERTSEPCVFDNHNPALNSAATSRAAYHTDVMLVFRRSFLNVVAAAWTTFVVRLMGSS